MIPQAETSRNAAECQSCGSHLLHKFLSLNLKVCADCGAKHDWQLKPGQKQLLGPSRVVKKAQK